MALRTWDTQPPSPGSYPPAPAGPDFVGRTVSGITGALERAIFNEEQARLPGLLQRIDARAKVMATLFLLLGTGLARHLLPIAALYLVTILLARLSLLPLAGFVKRAWLGIPLFAGIVVLPSIFMLPGHPLLTVLEVPPFRLAVTDNGVSGATLLIARVGTSVSLALLLVFTTRWTELLRGLRVLGVPASFLAVLSMTYRYIFLFLRGANNLFLARASRTVGATTGAEQRRWAAAATGTLVSRSVKLSGEVLLAMRARGFEGEIRSPGAARMRDEDWLVVALAAVVAASVLLLDGGIV